MNAMIFAAGLGTRLRPLTDHCPKALVKIGDKTLLEMALNKLVRLGATKIIVNVHHFANQIIEFIETYPSEKTKIIISNEQEQLLDTGGGLLKAASLFDKNVPILIYNVDVVTNANLEALIHYHQASNNLVTLLTQDRKASRFLLFNHQNLLAGWRNPKTGEEKWVTKPHDVVAMGFNGIQVINPELLTLISKRGAFPIIPEYLNLAKEHRIEGWNQWQGKWFDAGTPEKIREIAEFMGHCSASEYQSFY